MLRGKRIILKKIGCLGDCPERIYQVRLDYCSVSRSDIRRLAINTLIDALHFPIKLFCNPCLLEHSIFKTGTITFIHCCAEVNSVELNF